MRITGGDARGRSLKIRQSSLSSGLRPTSQKVRKALFDILRERIIDSVFLDLFAGSGAVGIEAVSRGARESVIVEQRKDLIKAITRTVESFNISDRTVIINDDALRYLKKSEHSFDIIFADPPYNSPICGEIISIVNAKGLLREGGLFIIEHSSKGVISEEALNIQFKRTYRYGDTSLSFFANRG